MISSGHALVTNMFYMFLLYVPKESILCSLTFFTVLEITKRVHCLNPENFQCIILLLSSKMFHESSLYVWQALRPDRRVQQPQRFILCKGRQNGRISQLKVMHFRLLKVFLSGGLV